MLVPTFGAIHGKLLGGGVAYALATCWRVCPKGTSFNFGNLTRGVNPLFMLSIALPLLVGKEAAFQIYIEDTVLLTE